MTINPFFNLTEQALMDQAPSEAAAEALESGARRLVEGDESDGMGEAYKVFVIAPSTAPAPPLPFGLDQQHSGG